MKLVDSDILTTVGEQDYGRLQLVEELVRKK